MISVIKRVCNTITTSAVVLTVILAVLLVGLRLVGLQPFVVLSGSMEPKYPVGSMIYVAAVDPEQLRTGDPVTFYLNDKTVATHRIIEVCDTQALAFRTKGDANQTPDGDPIAADRIIGKPVFCIPYLGYVSNYIQQPPGRYVTLGVGLLVILLAFAPDLFQAFDDRNRKEHNEDQEENL